MTTKSLRTELMPNTGYHDEIVISGIARRFPDSDNMYQLKENLMNKVDLVSDDDRGFKEMTTESLNTELVPNTRCDNEIVISGIAGRFPDSDNMYQLKENLMNKVDLVSDDDRRWKSGNPEIPQRTGKVNNVNKFDSLFFGVHFKQTHSMDPMLRMLLEHAYEAVIDAGMNPRQLRGTKTGVFIGFMISESERTMCYEKVNGFSMTGCSKAMLANRISYWLGLTGPSFTVDSACSSSLFAMENAYRAIRTGQCEAALVGGAQLCLHPCISQQYYRLGVLSSDGRCKTFDADANGYARSEAVGMVYLQKAKNAKRLYATYVTAKVNCDGFKEQGITFPSGIMQSTLLNELYEECGLPPSIVSYVEAHGTGTVVGDPEEVNAIDRVFSPGRTTPLKIGSVKSNLGHAEAASGICSIAKTIIAMESGVIPPNLHYKCPRKGIKSLEDGRIKVVTEATPWEGGYIGINSFGFGGANAHILLKSNCKDKINNGAPTDDLLRLVIASGRTEEAVKCILNDVGSRPVDAEYVRLIQDIHADDIPGHMYRGYTIVGENISRDSPIKYIQQYSGTKRPVWFVFTGMGCQWSGMGTALLKLPIFAKAIKKCDAALKPRGVDIYNILTKSDDSDSSDNLRAVVGIISVQIGLVDVLMEIGIIPDKMIGHSIGEFGCAYADGCLTAEQTVLGAYVRALALRETEIVCGSMAAVGLGYNDVKDLCPQDIEIACHNSPISSTVSGPTESVEAFVAMLQEKNIFVRHVSCNKIPYHSRYLTKVGPRLLAYLEEIIPEPKQRSSKWLSTSVPCSEWDTVPVHFSSAEYYTNNLINPVYFEECLLMIPEDAVVIEIAPHSLLQAILRRSLSPQVMNIGLTQRGSKDNVENLLQGFGKLFTVGLQPKLANLYPEIQFPVSRGTPMLSPLVRWEHTEDWFVPSYSMEDKMKSGGLTVTISLVDKQYEYMSGYVINGKNYIPPTGYLIFVWETVATMNGKTHSDFSVIFENVKFLRDITLPEDGQVKLTLMIHEGTGRFEIVEDKNTVTTGIISRLSELSHGVMDLFDTSEDDGVIEKMSSGDVYRDLRLRGHNYSGMFRSIKSSTVDTTKGTIAWMNNWVTFMDSMLQMNILCIESREPSVPMEIQKITIDTKYHFDTLNSSKIEEPQFTVRFNKDYGVIIAGGIEICGIKARTTSRGGSPRDVEKVPVLQSYQFVAHRDNAEMNLQDFIQMSAHIAVENCTSACMKTVEVVIGSDAPVVRDLISTYLVEILRDYPLIQSDVNVITLENPFEIDNSLQHTAVETLENLRAMTPAMLLSVRDAFSSSNTDTLNQLLVALKDGGFLLALEVGSKADIYALSAKNSLEIVLAKRVENKMALLLRKCSKSPNKMIIINVASNSFEWVHSLKETLKTIDFSVKHTKIILVSEKDFENGLMGLVRCLRKEPGGEFIRGYLIQDKNAPDFSCENPLYFDQLKLDLALNVLRPNGVWGTYRLLYLPAITERPVYQAWANQLVRGDITSFCWLEGPLRPTIDKKNLVHVAYASINARDVLLASDELAVDATAKRRYHQERPYGVEYSGLDASGRRVMGLVEAQAFANIAVIDKYLVWPVPDSWNLEDAATVPFAYTMCYYALYLNGRMNKDEIVLIHDGSSDIGQAAIMLALHEGCNIFTTVDTSSKRAFIKERFPQLLDDHIGNSGDISFESLITRQTRGRGVDIVLNSLADSKLQASVRCLAHGGRFLEIGKYNPTADNPLSIHAFLKDIRFIIITRDNFLHAPSKKKIELQKLLQAGIDGGAVQPLSRTVFLKKEIGTAFRCLVEGKHIGKQIIRIHDNNESLTAPIEVSPRFYCLEGRSYVIIGGLGGMGLELADWLVLRGAKNLVLTSRRGVNNGYQSKCIALWKSYGIKVVTIAEKKVHDRADCEHILKTAECLGPVDAIFNLTICMLDALMENQTVANFEETFKGKVWGTKQLDRVSRKICLELRHFVTFSTYSSVYGAPGLSNYAMANSMMETICENRVAEGLPGLAIQWGTVGDVGFVIDSQERNKETNLGGTLQQGMVSCLVQIDKFLNIQTPIVTSMCVAEKCVRESKALSVVDTVRNIIGLKDLQSVSPYTPLSELGMDSLMVAEIRQALQSHFEIFLSAEEIRSFNFSKFQNISARNIVHEMVVATK